MYEGYAEWNHNIKVTGNSMDDLANNIFRWFEDNSDDYPDGNGYRFIMVKAGELTKTLGFCYHDYYADF